MSTENLASVCRELTSPWLVASAVFVAGCGRLVGGAASTDDAVPDAMTELDASETSAPDGDLAGCATGDKRCESNSVEICTSRGTWGPASPCADSTCISSGTTALCEGTCMPGARSCSGDQPESCVNGQWASSGSPCSGGAPACWEGACVVCAPSALGCDGDEPRQCNASGTGWDASDASCSGAKPACLDGACVACAPGSTRCIGNLVEECDGAGVWETEACPAGDVCFGAGCTPGCSISGSLYAAGAPNPMNACEGCDPTMSTTAWSDVDGASCGVQGTCCSGTCIDATTDIEHCGACGTECTDGPSAACSAGVCNYTLASGGSPFGIAVGATLVYWTDYAAGTVMGVPIVGGDVVTFASGQGNPSGVAVDATNVYWVSSPSNGEAAIVKEPVAGGIITTLASDQSEASFIAVDATSVYWATSDSESSIVMKVALDGGTPVTLASGQDWPGGIAVDSESIYWTSQFGDDVVKAPLDPIDGGTPVTLASGQNWPAAIAVNASGVYWDDYASVEGLAFASGAGTTFAIEPEARPSGIVADATTIYWTNSGAGLVLKAPIAGGTPTTLADLQSSPVAVAVDSTYVYWIADAYGGGAIMKAPK